MKVLDLFCGPGGLSSGFKRQGFDTTGVDESESAGKTYELNNTGKFFKLNLGTNYHTGKFDVVIGGPPCKPWTSVNLHKRRSNHSDYKMIKRFYDHVDNIRPTIFVMENVPLLDNKPTLLKQIARMEKIGYNVSRQIIKYSDFGATTSRRRLIVIGKKENISKNIFEELEKLKMKAKTIKDAIGYLKGIEESPETNHVWPKLKTIDKYMKYYKTGKYGWYILEWNKQAKSFGNVMKTYILHPQSSNGGPKRVISVKEAALIMGFKRDFKFPMNTGIGNMYQMIVDSVSPIFSNALAKTIKKILVEV